MVTAYITYGGESEKFKLNALSKFGANRQESASKTATSHIQNVTTHLKNDSDINIHRTSNWTELHSASDPKDFSDS